MFVQERCRDASHSHGHELFILASQSSKRRDAETDSRTKSQWFVACHNSVIVTASTWPSGLMMPRKIIKLQVASMLLITVTVTVTVDLFSTPLLAYTTSKLGPVRV